MKEMLAEFMAIQSSCNAMLMDETSKHRSMDQEAVIEEMSVIRDKMMTQVYSVWKDTEEHMQETTQHRDSVS